MILNPYRNRVRLRTSGWAFLTVFLLVQLAAWNTGTNLLYMIVGALISVMLLGWFLGRGTLRQLNVTREAPATVHRGDLFATTVRIENRRKFFPAVSLRVFASLSDEHWYAYVAKVIARQTLAVRASSIMNKRGVHALPPIELRSGFPMGLFERRRYFKDHNELVVFPRVSSLRTGVLEVLDGTGETPIIRVGDGDEFFGLRDYIPGDAPRRIAWRVSARRGHLVVRELEPSTSHTVYIAFDTRSIPEMEDFEENFEKGVDLVASLASSFLNRQYCVSVICPQGGTELGEGPAHTTAILHFLARIEPALAFEYDDEWYEAFDRTHGAGYLYISIDPARWGERGRVPGGRILDPKEVIRA